MNLTNLDIDVNISLETVRITSILIKNNKRRVYASTYYTRPGEWQRIDCDAAGVSSEWRHNRGAVQPGLDWPAQPGTTGFCRAISQESRQYSKLAADLDIAYNTARSRLDEIVTALGGAPENDHRADRRLILDRLAAKEISVEEAMRLLKS